LDNKDYARVDEREKVTHSPYGTMVTNDVKMSSPIDTPLLQVIKAIHDLKSKLSAE